MLVIMQLLVALLLITQSLSYRNIKSLLHNKKLYSTSIQEDTITATDIPKRGIIDYKGSTVRNDGQPRWSTHQATFTPQSSKELFFTKYKLWRQLPWKKIKGKAVIKVKLQGALPLDAAPSSSLPFSGQKNLEPVTSLTEFINLLLYSSYDPRISGIYIELGPLQCGYAKLQEITRIINYFKQSNKKIIGYSELVSEKELFVAQSFNEFYIPPDAGIDLRGFSSSASFVRGVFDKIGIEPQVQRIGKYKSFGDTFNRTEISTAQREVISALLTETSDYWVDYIANAINTTTTNINTIFNETKVQTPYDYKNRGLVTGVRYKDQVDIIAKEAFSTPKKSWFSSNNNGNIDSTTDGNSSHVEDKDLVDIEAKKDFELYENFDKFPRRKSGLNATELHNYYNNTGLELPQVLINKKQQKSKNKKKPVKLAIPSLIPAGLYLKKMRKASKILQGLPILETRVGSRIAIINAIGGINSGESSSSGLNGPTIGSDTLITLIREAKYNPAIKAVVLRIDSPGGSALASDVIWRELRSLSRVKPVVASQVDVAASGGYYLSMGCDEIVSEELTVTGSIGVVTSMFNNKKLNEKIGFNSETLSIGRYAELFSTSRGFTSEEEKYFEESAQKFYKSFITKAAASRDMGVEAMNEVAQGRVWTGRQALQEGLTDHMGGLWKAIEIAANMSCYHLPKNYNSNNNKDHMKDKKLQVRVQTLRPPRSGFGFPLSGASTSTSTTPMFLCDDIVINTGLVSPQSYGISPLMQKLGITPIIAATLQSSGLNNLIEQSLSQAISYSSEETSISINILNNIMKIINPIFETIETIAEDL